MLEFQLRPFIQKIKVSLTDTLDIRYENVAVNVKIPHVTPHLLANIAVSSVCLILARNKVPLDPKSDEAYAYLIDYTYGVLKDYFADEMHHDKDPEPWLTCGLKIHAGVYSLPALQLTIRYGTDEDMPESVVGTWRKGSCELCVGPEDTERTLLHETWHAIVSTALDLDIKSPEFLGHLVEEAFEYAVAWARYKRLMSPAIEPDVPIPVINE